MYILKSENRVAVKFYLYAEMSTENDTDMAEY
jgi:hypothetical protein